jgi:outer membrane protein assembly factor BamE
MPVHALCLRPSQGLRRLALGLAAGAMLAGCGTVDRTTQRVADFIQPYRVPVVQGNFVSREQVALLRPGQSRQQVRDLLGTPLLASVFHADRWDYVFTLRRQGVAPQAYRLTVYFKGEALERFEGDTMPTEAEFVASLDVSRKGKAPPLLEATEAQLKRFALPAASGPAPAAVAPPATAYPPLEPPAR